MEAHRARPLREIGTKASPDGWRVCVGALAVAAFAIRLSGIDQSLFGDELYTYADVHDRSLTGTLEKVGEAGNEITPPLYFVLAWATARVGSPETWVRLPSVLLAGATIPLVYSLGRRLATRSAGLVAAALLTISPVSIWFSEEARAYSTAVFLVVLCPLLLLRALEREQLSPWVFYAIALAAALYTHYTVIVPLAILAGWAVVFHRDRAVHALLANAAAAAAFLPWILISSVPAVNLHVFDALVPLTPRYVGRTLLQVFPGHAAIRPSVLPGTVALWTLGVVVVIALVLAGVRALHPGARPAAAIVLLCGLALGTPAVVLLYSVLEHNIFGTRSLLCALPFFLLLVGWALTSLPRSAAVVAVCVALVVTGKGMLATVAEENRRPPFNLAARYLDRNARPDEVIVQNVIFNSPTHPLGRGLDLYLQRRHELRTAGVDDQEVWRDLEHGERAFLVVPRIQPDPGPPLLPDAARRVTLEQRVIYHGLISVAVLRYRGRAGD